MYTYGTVPYMCGLLVLIFELGLFRVVECIRKEVASVQNHIKSTFQNG